MHLDPLYDYKRRLSEEVKELKDKLGPGNQRDRIQALLKSEYADLVKLINAEAKVAAIGECIQELEK